MPQERRSYSKSFKAQVIAECAQPDTSIANVALTHWVYIPVNTWFDGIKRGRRSGMFFG